MVNGARRVHTLVHTEELGFSTCLIRIVAMLERNGILKIASVGDCGLRVIREGKTQCFSFSPSHELFLNLKSFYPQ